jgi:hypothetical protein
MKLKNILLLGSVNEHKRRMKKWKIYWDYKRFVYEITKQKPTGEKKGVV